MPLPRGSAPFRFQPAGPLFAISGRRWPRHRRARDRTFDELKTIRASRCWFPKSPGRVLRRIPCPKLDDGIATKRSSTSSHSPAAMHRPYPRDDLPEIIIGLDGFAEGRHRPDDCLGAFAGVTLIMFRPYPRHSRPGPQAAQTPLGTQTNGHRTGGVCPPPTPTNFAGARRGQLCPLDIPDRLHLMP
jgi:hypothetical protein